MGIMKILKQSFFFPVQLLKNRNAESTITIEKMKTESGALIQREGKKIAVYKDTKGVIHTFSPSCPHLGCYVEWDEQEKNWLCPCHDSRFSPEGKVLKGPAKTDLKAISLE